MNKKCLELVLKNTASHVILIILTAVILLPIFYMISTAFRPNQSILAPMFDFNTWTDGTIADKRNNTLSKSGMIRSIDDGISDIIGSDFKLPGNLRKALVKWVRSNGKYEEEFLSLFKDFISDFEPEIYDDLTNLIYMPNGSLKYRYDIRVTLANFRFFFTGNYPDVIAYNYPVKKWFYNSMIISSTVTFIQVFVVIFAAFAISRFRFYGRRAVVMTVVVLQIFPASMMMIAYYLLLDYIGGIVPSFGIDTIGGLIFIYLGAGIPLNIWLAKGYFSSIPESLEESAMIDGADYYQTFFLVIMPVISPVIIVIAILSFIAAYNEFLLATLLITRPENLTLPVGLSFFIDGDVVKFSTFSAIAVIGSIPVLVIWLFFQNYIIDGLTHSSVKG